MFGLRFNPEPQRGTRRARSPYCRGCGVSLGGVAGGRCPECGTAVEAAAAGSPAGQERAFEWELIPLDVPCGRCGERLNGLAEPVCPRCGLEFRWSDLLPPVEDMHCRECGYVVYGSTGSRCPECGTGFDWESVTEAARSRQNHLFEHWWTRRPLPSLLRTWWLAALRPDRLWAEHSIHDPPRVLPLLLFLLLQWGVFFGGWYAVAALAGPAINHVSRWGYEHNWLDLRLILPGPIRYTYQFRPPTTFMPFVACWYVATFLSFQVFVLTKRRYRIRWQQILRVLVHSTALASLATALWCLAEVSVDASLLLNPGWQRFAQRLYATLGQVVFVLAVTATWAHIWFGFHRYLRTPRGWGTAALCLVLGNLLARLAELYM